MRVAASVAVGATLVLTGCGSSPGYSDIMSGAGWRGAHGDAHNSATTDVTGDRTLNAAWSRTLDGRSVASASIGSDGQVFVVASAAAGCNLFSYQMKTGRQRFCDHVPLQSQRPSRMIATPIVDDADNTYVGDEGFMRSYNEHGQERWWMQVLGTPMSAQFTGDGNVLEVTQLGEVTVFDRQNGDRVVPGLRLLGEPDPQTQPNLPWPPNDQGLDACATGAPACPVATSPAMDPKNGRVALTLWRPNAAAASLVGLRYAGGRITTDWRADILGGGSVTSPALSADGSVVYAADNAGDLMAVDAATGKTRWSYHLGFSPTALSVSDNGLIIPAGGDGSHLLALRDGGDHAAPAWDRKDLIEIGTPAQTGHSIGYTVVRTQTDRTATLLAFRTTDGSTLAQYPLPTDDHTVGTAVGPKGEVVVTTEGGRVYAFTQPD
jgi:outer membrane protein assembly factor BamB